MQLRQLDRHNENDIRLGARIFCAAPQYMADTFGRPPTEADGRRFVTHVPPDVQAHDILVYAALDGAMELGLIQVQRRYMHAHRANIGLLLVDPAHRRRGVGGAMLAQLSQLSAGWSGISTFSVSVLETNGPGLAFWRRAGFRTLVEGFVEPGYTTRLTVMERAARPVPPPTAPRPVPAASAASAGIFSSCLGRRRL